MVQHFICVGSSERGVPIIPSAGKRKSAASKDEQQNHKRQKSPKSTDPGSQQAPPSARTLEVCFECFERPCHLDQLGRFPFDGKGLSKKLVGNIDLACITQERASARQEEVVLKIGFIGLDYSLR